MPTAIRTFQVKPRLPEELNPLLELAYNLAWAWQQETRDLFGRVDRELWAATNHNPVLMLGNTADERLQQLAADDSFLSHMQECLEELRSYLAAPAWFNRQHPELTDSTIAYFSMEFGIVESLPVYSGGLGILAGDFLKSASDLGVPLIGIGLLYQEGYLSQQLNLDGWQQERYPRPDFCNLPIRPVLSNAGQPLTIDVPYPGRMVQAQVLEAVVGRTRLYLLDAGLESNDPVDREITRRLYGGDNETRIRQEIMLGIGGVIALEQMGIEPAFFHMNEGHSAFLGLQRASRLLEQQLDFDEAQVLIKNTTLFTTHTPVPAGIDQFPLELIDRYAESLYRRIGMERQDFIALGHQPDSPRNAPFNMAYLAMNFASRMNGVSELHGKVARNMWKHRWPSVPEHEVPLRSVTNGVHLPSWISREMNWLLNRYLGQNWQQQEADPKAWEKVDTIPDQELWRVHQNLRSNLVSFARRHVAHHLQSKGATRQQIEAAAGILDPAALTIGFARRFATYKRAGLLFRHPERLLRLIGNPERPVQFVFAGKAHPRDDSGKELIRDVIQFIRKHDLQEKMVFLEDYDMNLARTMVQGVDVWLNTPRRPLEASGTSGMKVLPNGGLNFSVLDGWWVEGCTSAVGWAIGRDEDELDPEQQDERDACSIYDQLEQEIIPLFYRRDSHDLPQQWVEMMKNSLRTLSPRFNSDRMLQEYCGEFYLSGIASGERFSRDEWAVTRDFSSWMRKLKQHWNEIRIQSVTSDQPAEITSGDQLEISCRVTLGQLAPEDVTVQLYYGPVDSSGNLDEGKTVTLEPDAAEGDTVWHCILPCSSSGRQGFNLRVLPHHPELTNPLCPGLVHWAEL